MEKSVVEISFSTRWYRETTPKKAQLRFYLALSIKDSFLYVTPNDFHGMSTCEYKNNCSWYALLNKHTCNGKPVNRDDECNYYKIFGYLDEKDELKPDKEYSTTLLKYQMSQVD